MACLEVAPRFDASPEHRRRPGAALEAAAQATGTAGSAVVFAGATVVIALVGPMVVDIPF